MDRTSHLMTFFFVIGVYYKLFFAVFLLISSASLTHFYSIFLLGWFYKWFRVLQFWGYHESCTSTTIKMEGKSHIYTILFVFRNGRVSCCYLRSKYCIYCIKVNTILGLISTVQNIQNIILQNVILRKKMNICLHVLWSPQNFISLIFLTKLLTLFITEVSF